MPHRRAVAASLSPLRSEVTLAAILFLLFAVSTGFSEDAPPAQKQPAASEQVEAAPAKTEELDAPVPLNKEGTVILDKKNGKLLLKGEICLREGLLEMLVCRKKSKEHESVASVDAEAFVIHAGLVALGAEPGHPVKWQPAYAPPAGRKIDIFFSWVDKQGTAHRRAAHEVVRETIHKYHLAILDPLPSDLELGRDDDLRYDQATKELIWFGPMTDAQRDEQLKRSKNKAFQTAINNFHAAGKSKELKADFVFAGSGFSKLEDGTLWYQAEAGNLICVANFGDAMIDVAIKSSADNEAGLMFEPYTERLPALGTPVTIELIPAKLPAPQAGAATAK